MKMEGPQQLLRIFINESDEWQGLPLYKAMVEMMRKAGIAGCTVVRGVEGFGQAHQIHDARFDSLFLDLPVILEVVDTEENIRRIIPQLDPMVKVGLMTLEKVDVKACRT